MELIERDSLLESLRVRFKNISEGEGHCVFISGEAGIGKTSLVKAFCKEKTNECLIYQGACDALFTPRPLAPLYDILWQVNKNLWPASNTLEQRSELFARFYQELSARKETILIVFEDIHWADEATLDFIKFFARRIVHLNCLFILTYRDDDIPSGKALKNVMGQLPPDSFTRLTMMPLSRDAVKKLSNERGYSGEDVYSISGGNPFYVTEILASYSPGVPENIKDAILSVYDRQEEGTKNVWQLFSVVPEGLKFNDFAKIKLSGGETMDHCFALKIIIIKNEKIIFKHELYRRTIEDLLPPLKRVALHKKILDFLLPSFEEAGEIERIVHYAKNANENETVVKYAPLAAKLSASVGSHIEASKLYLTAIEYADQNNTDQLVEFYEAYAYECSLTNQFNEAIAYQEKALQIWEEKGLAEQIGNSFRLLSRLWWFNGNRDEAVKYGQQAIEVLEALPPSKAKAMCYSNMSQLKMLAELTEECIYWGEKAIAMAKELNDEEIHSHALSNVGNVKMRSPATRQEGISLFEQSVGIALENSYHEQAARAYTYFGSSAVNINDYPLAEKMLNEGINYCEEKGLDSWSAYMLAEKAKLLLKLGDWQQAANISASLLKNDAQPTLVRVSALTVAGTIMMRKGEPDAFTLLMEAKAKSFETMELQRLVPSVIALLEYEWITSKSLIEESELNLLRTLIQSSGNLRERPELAFWLQKARNESLMGTEAVESKTTNSRKIKTTAAPKQTLPEPYEQALALFEGDEDDKRIAISSVQAFGATAVYEKMKQEMRASGIKSIPRGIRKSTQSNVAFLTSRELDVLQLLQKGIQNKEIAGTLFISPKTADHHISSIFYKLEVNSRSKAVTEAVRLGILK